MRATLIWVLIMVVKILVVTHVLLGACAYTVWLERKLVGRMQNRWGPTRVGPFGLLQPLADGLKFILKEDLTPPTAHELLFLFAPLVSVVLALTAISVIPFGGNITIGRWTTSLEITGGPAGGDINIALLILLGVTSIA